MARTPITKQEFDANFTLGAGFGNSNPIEFTSRIFDFETIIEPCHGDLKFHNCEFNNNFKFVSGFKIITVTNNLDQQHEIFDDTNTNIFDINLEFNTCDFNSNTQFDNLIFNGKFRMLDCNLEKVSFNNTSFNNLADFWATTFKQNTIFHKTDFNKTSVFSMATFEDNILFTYALFTSKAIFARTKFKKGLDLSQTIISGNLQLFDLQFNFKDYKAPYVGKDDETYQKHIDSDAIIPLENKVHTFQVLKKAFQDIGNYSDSILMQREEKRALKELIKEKLKVNNSDVNKGDKWILRLNRWSNHYQSDFRNGIWFTLGVTIVFGLLTLVFTEEFQRHFCWGCEFDKDAFIKGVKFLFNFLNPARRITYLDSFDLRFYGIAYLFDFFGRMAVGYGIYQTIQAFRKFK